MLHLPSGGEDANIKNLVVYEMSMAVQPLLPGLSTANVTVSRSADFSVNRGTATVSITGYEFKFVLPMVPKKITMPSYSTTLTVSRVDSLNPNLIRALKSWSKYHD